MTTKKTLGFGVGVIVFGVFGIIMVSITGLPTTDCYFDFSRWTYRCTSLPERDPLVTFASGILILSIILIVGCSLIIAFMGGVLRGRQYMFLSKVRADKIVAWIALIICIITIFVMIGFLTINLPILFAQ